MMTLLTLISLFFIPATKSGTVTAVVCPACITVCAVPLNPLCWACLVALCGGATVVTGCFNSDTKIYKMEYGQIKDVPIYELKKNEDEILRKMYNNHFNKGDSMNDN